MLTICLLILVGYYLRKPVGDLVDKLKRVEWSEKFGALWEGIQHYAVKAGRFTARPLLQLYYVVTDSETTTAEKAMIYAAIAYVVLPFSLVPRKIFKLTGIMDEAAALLFVYSKVKDKMTPAIEAKVESTLDAWFGSEYSVIA